MQGSGFNPYHQPQRRVTYHSQEWEVLVETGWITATVENGIALMFRDDSKDKRIYMM